MDKHEAIANAVEAVLHIKNVAILHNNKFWEDEAQNRFIDHLHANRAYDDELKLTYNGYEPQYLTPRLLGLARLKRETYASWRESMNIKKWRPYHG